MVTKWVVAIFCQSRHFDFVLISVYAPPRKPMQHTLGLVEEMLARYSSANVVVAGDFNAKHRAWGPRAGDDRGARVMELAAAAGLMVLNDPLSPPTYENTYASSWIDVTLATPAVVAAGYVWQVSDNVTFSEHKYVTVRVGSREVASRKRLTRYAQAELLTALSRETWFGRVVGSRLARRRPSSRYWARFIECLTATWTGTGGLSGRGERGTPGGRPSWRMKGRD